jgi:small basic protein
MKNVVILCVIAGLLGGSIGYIVPVVIPTEYNKLFSVAILAGIESVCSAIKLIIRDKGNIFIITFFANVIIAVLFVFIGDSLGLDLYYVILLALGFKLLQDLDVVKTYIFTK